MPPRLDEAGDAGGPVRAAPPDEVADPSDLEGGPDPGRDQGGVIEGLHLDGP